MPANVHWQSFSMRLYTKNNRMELSLSVSSELILCFSFEKHLNYFI